MNNPPVIHEKARSTLESLSRFWHFKRKKLAVELQGYLDDAQCQLDTLFDSNQQLAEFCAGQNELINELKSRNVSLSETLKIETANLALTTEVLSKAKVYAKDLEEQLVDKEQFIQELQHTIAETRQQLEALNNVKQVLTDKCTEQAKQIDLLDSDNKVLITQLQTERDNTADLKERKAQVLAEMAILQHYLADLKKALAEKEQCIGELKNTVSDAQQQIEVLNDAKQQLVEQRIEQAAQIDSLESDNEALKNHLKIERANVAELEINLEKHKEQHLSLTEKFSLVSKVLAQQPPYNEELAKFANLINHDYINFASRESSLAGEAQAMLDMQAIHAEMQMLNNFPSIAGKTILSIAGGFSSGKSAFVNSFICNPKVKLATGINPVTVVPSYVVCSEETRIKGYSYSGGAIGLPHDLYASMSHEYVKTFGFDLRRILPFISVKVPMDSELFGNLCIIDTPGYNPGTTGGAAASDRSTAASLVNQASALVWVIGLDPAGTIDQSDIEFLESTPFRAESLYIVLNKADVKSQDEILEIMEQVADDLSFAGIDYAGMCAYSSTRKKDYPYSGLTFEKFLRSINRKVDVVGKITGKLDTVFDAYKHAIQVDIAQLERQKREFEEFKLDALEIGGTELFDRIDRAFSASEQALDSTELEKLAIECEELRNKLKLAAKKVLAYG